METFTIELPAMFGDHHVLEVRRLMFEVPGVESVYASSGFHTLEVGFDETRTEAEALRSVLEQAGYLGELETVVETGTAGAQEDGRKPFFRHTTAAEQTNQTVSFAQQVPFAGRPLWPCPGFGPLEQPKIEEVE